MSGKRRRDVSDTVHQSVSEVPCPSSDGELDLFRGGSLNMSSLSERRYCKISPKVGLS